MDIHERIKTALFKAIDDVNSQLLEEQRVEKSTETVLTGNQAKLDSLALVNLIVVGEGFISNEFGTSISLLDEEPMVKLENPFQTVGTFIDYVYQLLKERGIE